MCSKASLGWLWHAWAPGELRTYTVGLISGEKTDQLSENLESRAQDSGLRGARVHPVLPPSKVEDSCREIKGTELLRQPVENWKRKWWRVNRPDNCWKEGGEKWATTSIKPVLEAGVSRANTQMFNFLRNKSQEMQFQIQKHLAALAERSVFMHPRKGMGKRKWEPPGQGSKENVRRKEKQCPC